MVTGKVCTLNIKLQCKSTSLQRVHLACGLLGLWVVAWERFVVAERQPCISGNPQKRNVPDPQNTPHNKFTTCHSSASKSFDLGTSIVVEFVYREGKPCPGLLEKFVQHNAKTHVAICEQQVCKGTTTCDTHDENYSSFRHLLGEYDTTTAQSLFLLQEGI